MRYPIFSEQRALVNACETKEEVITVMNYINELERRLDIHFGFVDFISNGNEPTKTAIDQEVKNMEIMMSLIDILRNMLEEKLG